MQQIINVNSEKEAILMAKPDFDGGQVSFRTIYEADCWRSQVQLMYILGEAMFIAQHYTAHKDGQGNFDYILLPIDRLNPNGYALRKKVEAIALPETFITFGGISKAKDKAESASAYTENEDEYLQVAKEEYFAAIRVGIHNVWKLQREIVGWGCPNPREDVYPFTNTFNAGQQIKHPAEIALALLQGGLIKIHGNFASDKFTHPREHIIKGYRQAFWRMYYPSEKFPTAETAK